MHIDITMNLAVAQIVAPVMIIAVALVISAPIAGLASSPLGPPGTATATTGNVAQTTESMFWQTIYQFSYLLPYIGIALIIEGLALLAWKYFKPTKPQSPQNMEVEA